MTCGSHLYVVLQIYIPKIPGVSSAYEYTPLDFHLEYEVHTHPSSSMFTCMRLYASLQQI